MAKTSKTIDPYKIGLSNSLLQPGTHIHLIGVCGTGMSAMARVLIEAGFVVSGSDLRDDPPTGPALRDWGVDIYLGYEFEALDSNPDLVVVGNAVTSENAVALAAIERGLPVTHMPALLNMLIAKTRKRVVIAGTHGKSTTSAITAWLLQEAGLDPGWMIGATPLFGNSGKFGSGPFVIEGDEYNCAYFDRGAKFLHYKPEALGVTTVEFDHADLYDNLAQIDGAFEKLLGEMNDDGLAVLADDAERFSDCKTQAQVQQLTTAGFKLLQSGLEGVEFEVARQKLAFSLPGRHSAVDAAIAALLANRVGVNWQQIAEALPRYPGLKLRQEVLADSPIRVLRDFGHHPTEIKATLAGLRDAWPDEKITAVFEPRSYTARTDTMREDYIGAFESADKVFFAPVFRAESVKQTPLDTAAIAKAIGQQAQAFLGFEVLENALRTEVQEGVVIFFSNGMMDGLPGRFADLCKIDK